MQTQRDNKGNTLVVFDLEADGLNPTKIHVLSANVLGTITSSDDYKRLSKLMTKTNVRFIGHNITRFDRPVIQRLLGIKVRAKLVDTLALSWALFPERTTHGLADWGEEFGVPKPPIEDWVGLTYEEYRHRCEEDVRINTLLWEHIWSYLCELYSNEDEIWRYIDYLQFKMECAALQEESKWKLNKPKAIALKEQLSDAYKSEMERLKLAMPKVPVSVTKKLPAKPYKKNGDLSATGKRWFDLLDSLGKPHDTESVTYIDHYDEPNPASNVQIKDWLFSLGWEPCTFKYKRDKDTGDVRAIPQIRTKDDDNNPLLTDSVMRLIDAVPALEALRDTGVLKHRLDVVTGFLEAEEDGFICARINGLTNTLRFKHKEAVNLPGVGVPWGAELRGCLVARDGYELLGSDQAALEDRTKQHYMWPYDPEYVKEMLSDSYDPHIKMAVVAGMITEAQGDLFRWKKGLISKMPHEYEGFTKTAIAEEIARIKPARHKGKQTNYASTYGAGGKRIALTAGCSEKEGMQLFDAYWKINWSLKAIAEAQRTKKVNGQMWLYNPVSRFWYSLRHKKDIFSTLNQGTGVYCFDTWVKYILSKRRQLTAQFHDEVVLEIKKGHRAQAEKLVRWAVDMANKELKLNRDLDISVDFGDCYADIH